MLATGSPILAQGKTPLAEHIPGMRVRRCKAAFHLNPFINGTGKPFKFTAVHLLADKFIQTPLEPGLLGGGRTALK